MAQLSGATKIASFRCNLICKGLPQVNCELVRLIHSNKPNQNHFTNKRYRNAAGGERALPSEYLAYFIFTFGPCWDLHFFCYSLFFCFSLFFFFQTEKSIATGIQMCSAVKCNGQLKMCHIVIFLNVSGGERHRVVHEERYFLSVIMIEPNCK